jgi:hypothetical protein
VEQLRKWISTQSAFCSEAGRERSSKQLEVKEKKMNKTLLCLVLLALASVTVVAQTVPGVITINGGREIVALHGSQSAQHVANPEAKPASPFFTDLDSPYACGIGWTVSDGSPENVEQGPASEFVSLKSGRVHSITVAAGFSVGNNDAIVILDKECGKEGKGDLPCGKIDQTNICKGHIKHMPNFGTNCTKTETIKCGSRATLKKGQHAWVYLQTGPTGTSADNSLLAWNQATGSHSMGDFLFLSDTGGVDTWQTPEVINTLGAFSVQ